MSAVALIAGVPTGLIGGAFRWCLQAAAAYSTQLLDRLHLLGVWGALLMMGLVAACAAIASLIVLKVPLAAGSGIQHVEAVWRRESKAPPLRVVPARFLGGVLGIGAGLVLGREGPTVHMGAALGAASGRLTRRSDSQVRTLQTALAGGGLAVAFNAPIGGALFAIEEVAKSVSFRVVIPIAFGVVSAVGCSRLILGDHPDFVSVHAQAPGLLTLPVFLVFGVATGALGVIYNRMVLAGVDGAARASGVPAPVRAAAIGAVIGLLAFVDPRVVSGGDEISQLIVSGQELAVPVALMVLVVRLVTGPLSYAAGTPGGLFAPLLAVGALWGLIWAQVAAVIVPGTVLRVAFAIVGMSAFFCATVRAPLTGVVLVMEMTATTSVAVPMIAAAGCALITAQALKSQPIYDSLRERMLSASR